MNQRSNFTTQASDIPDSIRAQAVALAASALDINDLKPFYTGAAGDFPYQWEVPKKAGFNPKTYYWISQNLAPNCAPNYTFQPGSLFPNEYIKAMSAIQYVLSKTDAGTGELQNEAKALIDSFNDNFGTKYTNVNQVIDYICDNWGPDGQKVTFEQLIHSQDLEATLPNTPPSGSIVLNVLVQYIQAYVKVSNAQKYAEQENDYLKDAIAGTRFPSQKNGGMQLLNQQWAPKYTVSQSVDDIIYGLKDDKSCISITVTIESKDKDTYGVQIQDLDPIIVHDLSFFDFSVGTVSDFLRSGLLSSTQKIQLTFTFSGLTLVQYEPMPFSMSISEGWLLIPPIQNALKNTGNDALSSYRFVTDPHLDFTNNGPFGFTNSVVISQAPSITVKLTSSTAEALGNQIVGATNSLSFLGRTTPVAATPGTNRYCLAVDASSSNLTVNFSPPVLPSDPDPNGDGTAWVLGARVSYPAAPAK